MPQPFPFGRRKTSNRVAPPPPEWEVLVGDRREGIRWTANGPCPARRRPGGQKQPTSAAAAALLNLTGLGAGYAYLRHRRRWVLYLLGTVGLAAAAYWIGGDHISPWWAVAALAWVATGAADAWRTAHGDAEPAGAGLRLGVVPIVVAAVLIIAEVTGFWAFRSAGQRALAAGWDAHKAGQCRTAVERYRDIGQIQRLTFTSVVASARANIRECDELLAARDAHSGRAFDDAARMYRSFLRRRPKSVLAPLATSELAQTYRDWAADSAERGDYAAAIETYEVVRDEFAGTPAATDADTVLVRTHRDWDRAYQQRLTAAGRKLRSSIARLRRIGAVPKLAGWFDKAQVEFGRVGVIVEAVAPPGDALEGQEQLRAALGVFSAALANTEMAVRKYELCAADSVLARLAAADAGRSLRSAQKSLGQQGFQLDLSEFGRARELNRRLLTGQFLVPGDRSGSNTMSIENKTRFDSLVVLTLGTKKPAMSVYVRAGEDYTISGIPDGSYRTYFTGGEDWASKYRTFTRKCAFATAGRKRLQLTSNASTYSVGTLTLAPRKKGGGHAPFVDPAKFPGGPG